MKTLVMLTLKGSGKKTLVELPELPVVGETKSISPTEVIRGPQPVGLVIASYIPARTLVLVTARLENQEYPTFEYKPAPRIT
ncbi:hypothetical protein KAZ57_03780 [Patescibacteria group bacterium]|nr:hypothetical protein [Patescibacteria group bacterium]